MTIQLSDIEWLRLARYLAGESDAVEATEVERWISADADRTADIDCLRQAINLRDAGVEQSDIDSARQRFEARLKGYLARTAGSDQILSRSPANVTARTGAEDSRGQVDEGSRTLRHVMPKQGVSSGRTLQSQVRIERVVAGIATAIRAGGNGREHAESLRRKRLPFNSGATVKQRLSVVAFAGLAGLVVMAVGIFSLPHHAKTARATYHTRTGQWSTVRFSDRSTMVLAPATTAVIDSGMIDVVGEAYFAVAPRSDRPYVVRTRNAMVRVLGTRFDVRHYADERDSRVVVEDGKVSLQPRGEMFGSSVTPTLMTQGMVMRVTDSGAVEPDLGSMRGYIEWTQGTLTFNDRPLSDVARALGRAYGVEITVQDSILARKTVLLEVLIHRETLAQVLDLISVAADARYRRVDSVYVLTPGRSSRTPPERNHFPHLEKSYGR